MICESKINMSNNITSMFIMFNNIKINNIFYIIIYKIYNKFKTSIIFLKNIIILTLTYYNIL